MGACRYELDKIAANHPTASLVLRIHASDPHARCQLGNKFGAMPYEVDALLERAMELELRVVGLSFHIGSGAQGTEAYTVAIAQARGVFNAAERLGLPPLSLLDLGGGFSDGTMARAAVAINAALDVHFPAADGVKVIAEPGRYFAESTHTLCCAVYGKRVRPQQEVGEDADTHQVRTCPTLTATSLHSRCFASAVTDSSPALPHSTTSRTGCTARSTACCTTTPPWSRACSARAPTRASTHRTSSRRCSAPRATGSTRWPRAQ